MEHGSVLPEDILILEDYPVHGSLHMVEYGITSCNSTGWGKSPEHIRLGKCGLVGDYWKELCIEVSFEGPVVGFWTDAVDLDSELTVIERGTGCSLPFRRLALAAGTQKVHAGAGSAAASRVSACCMFSSGSVHSGCLKFEWNSTDLHRLNGLSTNRDGGGLHLELLAQTDLHAGGFQRQEKSI